MMEKIFLALKEWWQRSTFLKVLLIGIVIFLLQIPIIMINGVIFERDWNHSQAIDEVTMKWGQQQIIIGPRLVIPYYEYNHWRDDKGKEHINKVKRYATFLPDTFLFNADVQSENRKRGLYEIPLYQATISMSGRFKTPNFERWGIEKKDVLWNESEILLGISDPHGIQKQIYLQWNKKRLPFEPGMGNLHNNDSGFHVLLDSPVSGQFYSYHIDMTLNGSQNLYIAPAGHDSQITIHSNWRDPSFQGFKLPTKRQIRANGFDASWEIPSISRHYPQQWLIHKLDESKLNASLVGVDFITPVDTYRMVERSIKYELLFLLVTFVVIWLIEILAGVRVHIIQYLFIGLGMCLFYLLLLALAEHIGFISAYVIASLVILFMTTAYSKAVLKNFSYSLLIGGVIVCLYSYLFILLQEQSYSLLLGSIGVLFIIATIMYITRNIDWNHVGKS